VERELGKGQTWDETRNSKPREMGKREKMKDNWRVQTPSALGNWMPSLPHGPPQTSPESASLDSAPVR
jgi:hypothetical protein